MKQFKQVNGGCRMIIYVREIYAALTDTEMKNYPI